MNGTELRRRRQALGVTCREVAERARVRTLDVETWERTGRIPWRLRADADGALWELECDAALRASGIPECDWRVDRESRPWEFDAGELRAHLDSCGVCAERSAFVAANLPPPPLRGGPVVRAVGLGARLTGWRRSSYLGALFLLAMGGTGVPVLLGLAVVRRESRLVALAGALLVVLLASGAVGGLVHHLTRGLRGSGAPGRYLGWILTVYGYLAAAGALVALGTLVLGTGAERQRALADLRDDLWITVASGTLVGGVFGAALARGDAPGGRARPSPAAPRKALPLRTVALVVLALVTIGSRYLIGTARARARANPSTAAEWAAVLPEREAAARAHPESPEAQRDLAWALVGLDRWKEARPVLERAARLSPGDADLANGLGWALLQEGRKEEALAGFEAALRLDPDQPQAPYNLAWTNYQLGRYAVADSAYRSLLLRDSTNYGVRAGHGWALLGLNRPAEAADEFRASVRLGSPDPWTHRGLVTAYKRVGRVDDALEEIRTVTRLTPSEPGAWFELGNLALLQRRYDEAAAAFARADSLDPRPFRESADLRAMWQAAREHRRYDPSTVDP